MTEFASYLSSKRTEKGIPLRQLAERVSMTCPVDHSTLSRLERGKQKPSAQHRNLLLALAKVLDLDDDETNELLTSAGLTPVTESESNVDKILNALEPERWRKTQFLMKLGWNRDQISKKLHIPFWEVLKDLEKAQASTDIRLILSLLEPGRRVLDFEKHQYARLVSFRLGNVSEALLIVEGITFLVTDCGTHEQGPEIEAAIAPYKYDVELSLNKTGETKITKTKFKLARFEADDYEVLFKSLPGSYFRGTINVNYTIYPQTNLLTLSSQPLELVFPNVTGAQILDPQPFWRLVAGSQADYSHILSNCLKQLSDGDRVELRIYVQKELTDGNLRQLQAKLARCGITLDSPVVQDAGIIVMRFTYYETISSTISSLRIPDIIGWQLFDVAGKYIQGVRRLTEGVMVFEEGTNAE